MAKPINMTKEKLFDLIAPIYLYHQADVCLLHEAKTAFKNLKKVRNDELVVQYFEGEHSSLDERSVINLDCKLFWKVYNHLFEEIVTAEFPDFRTSYDSYGAKCFMINGYMYLCGDAFDCFPFYMDSKALKERLMGLTEEVA